MTTPDDIADNVEANLAAEDFIEEEDNPDGPRTRKASLRDRLELLKYSRKQADNTSSSIVRLTRGRHTDPG